MTRREYWRLPIFSLSVVLAVGAFHHPGRSGGEYQGSDFLPETSFVPVASLSPEVSGFVLLDRFLASVQPAQAPWFQVKIRQQMRLQDHTVRTEGRLYLGPRHCARLEMELADPCAGKVLVVSNGHQLVRSVRVGKSPPEVEMLDLPDKEEKANADARQTARDRFLEENGCGGLVPVLKSARARLENLQQQKGVWKGLPVLRLWGEVKPGPLDPLAKVKPLTGAPAPAAEVASARHCFIHLDARTHWPHCLEWWSADRSGVPALLLLQMEFYDPEINKALDPREFARVFGYQPE